MKLSKTIYVAHEYAVCFCGTLSGRKLRRSVTYRKSTTTKTNFPWVRWFDVKSKKEVWACNKGFADAQFSKVTKHV